jgi:outer membrane protein assembly factor BamB
MDAALRQPATLKRPCPETDIVPRRFQWIVILASTFWMAPVAVAGDAVAPWSTYRGNPQRTGNCDGLGGPAKPKVLWTLKSQEHFIASPVASGDHVFVAGLGAFNVSTFYCLAADPKATQRVVWSKSTPYLKLPTVSSPALAGGKLVFGDGMHQTDGATLHCLRLDGGLPLWQLPVPGTLVHLEGSPTIEQNRVYVGGGAAGVLCVDLQRVTLDGKEQDLATIQKTLDQKWKVLVAQYEADKKKDPDFAVPPNEDQLPKPTPHLLWQQGRDKWHVDAPVTCVGDCVLVATAYLETAPCTASTRRTARCAGGHPCSSIPGAGHLSPAT